MNTHSSPNKHIHKPELNDDSLFFTLYVQRLKRIRYGNSSHPKNLKFLLFLVGFWFYLSESRDAAAAIEAFNPHSSWLDPEFHRSTASSALTSGSRRLWWRRCSFWNC